jgi:hypothetical protein
VSAADDDELAELLRPLCARDPGEEERALARFREACRRYDTDPAERARIDQLIADVDCEPGQPGDRTSRGSF